MAMYAQALTGLASIATVTMAGAGWFIKDQQKGGGDGQHADENETGAMAAEGGELRKDTSFPDEEDSKSDSDSDSDGRSDGRSDGKSDSDPSSPKGSDGDGVPGAALIPSSSEPTDPTRPLTRRPVPAGALRLSILRLPKEDSNAVCFRFRRMRLRGDGGGGLAKLKGADLS